MRTPTLVLAFAALTIGCGEGKKPCTDCPPVAGAYQVKAAAVGAENSSCGRLSMEAFEEEMRVEQDGSTLSTVGFLDVGGTLFEDLTVEFDQVPGTTREGNAGTFTFSGRFSGEAGARIFRGTLSFCLKSDGCTLNAPVTWTQHDP